MIAIITLIFVLLILGGITALIIVFSVINYKYSKFVFQHSIALKRLAEINSHYHFKDVTSFNMVHCYDNQYFYNHISCFDYLVYELVYCKKIVKEAIANILFNRNLFEIYRNEIKNAVQMNQFDTIEMPKNRKRLAKKENKIFERQLLLPIIMLTIPVKLTLTKMNGARVESKIEVFYLDTIESIIARLDLKRGNRYLDKDIWQSICRVERGRVSNKMRFAIYARDDYRCRCCGRKTRDLEIDHIFPIAKGGKSEYNNLQTLCHRCNAKKGNSIQFYF